MSCQTMFKAQLSRDRREQLISRSVFQEVYFATEGSLFHEVYFAQHISQSISHYHRELYLIFY
jgi:hypothetical protein